MAVVAKSDTTNTKVPREKKNKGEYYKAAQQMKASIVHPDVEKEIAQNIDSLLQAAQKQKVEKVKTAVAAPVVAPKKWLKAVPKEDDSTSDQVLPYRRRLNNV